MRATIAALRPASGGPHAPESGFVLVGVVIFVLALSILGLSLFSLSSYEAGFLGSEVNRAEAFYSALGGVDRAKFVLEARDSLGAIKLLESNDNVVYARARYVDTPDDTVSKPLDWSGSRDLEVRVLAEVRGQRRMVEAKFRTERDGFLYRNLITSFNGVIVEAFSDIPPPLHPRHTQTYLSGPVQQNSADTTWRVLANTSGPITFGNVPLPDAQGYIDAWQAFATTPTHVPGVGYELLATSDYTHFIGGSPGPGAGYGLYNSANDQLIRVSGTVIWMIPGGAYFYQHVSVAGTPGGPDDRLILVATKSSSGEHTPSPGLNFYGGLDSPDVPMIMISDGTVAMDQYNDYQLPNLLSYVSIHAGNVYIKGPWDQPPPVTAVFHHLDGSPYLDSDVLDDLIAWNVLPDAAGGGTAKFSMIPGSWREVTESNPD